MESGKNNKKWITMLLTAMLSVALLFGATACNDGSNNDGTDVVVEDNTPDVVVPDVDVDVDADSGAESPSPSASASE